MLKNAVTAMMSSAEAGLAQLLARRRRIRRRIDGELMRKIEHRTLPAWNACDAIVHHQRFAERGIAGHFAHCLAVGRQAVVAAIGR